MKTNLAANLRKKIRVVKDFPKKGILFQDITSITDDAKLLRQVVKSISQYVKKNKFPGIVLGLSGGIDSALSAAIAVDALGSENVFCLMMPSPYTSKESLEDANLCAQNLGVRLEKITVDPIINIFEKTLSPLFSGLKPDTTEENIQSRVRGR